MNVPLRYAKMLDKATIGGKVPFDYEVAELLRSMNDALLAATAYVELYTANGTQANPPAWAIEADGSFSAERIATRCRTVLKNGA